jgi:hypothetical protein
MPRLKATSSEAPGALTLSQEMLLIHGFDLLCGWQQSLERARWLETAEARQMWKRHRAGLIRKWLEGWPSELPRGSVLFDSRAQQRELLKLLKHKRAQLSRGKRGRAEASAAPVGPPRAADTATRKADLQ